jgi:hypothetical protein
MVNVREAKQHRNKQTFLQYQLIILPQPQKPFSEMQNFGPEVVFTYPIFCQQPGYSRYRVSRFEKKVRMGDILLLLRVTELLLLSR